MTKMRWVAAAVAVLAVLAAIGAGLNNSSGVDGGESSSAGATNVFAEAGGAADSDTEATGGSVDAAFDGGAPARSSTTTLILDQSAVIRTGSLALVTPELIKTQAEIRALVAALGGYLASENTQAAEDGEIRNAALVLRVPSEDFERAMERLAAFGDVTARTSSAKDVTREVADVDSRVSSAQSALGRIRLLLNRAESLGTVIRLESVLSDRQAALESLLAQQKALASQTQLSTIDVTLSVPSEVVPKPESDDDRGFMAGLRSGWDAFTTMISGIATAAGALLPFSVLLALLGIPAWVLTRRFRTGRAQTG